MKLIKAFSIIAATFLTFSASAVDHTEAMKADKVNVEQFNTIAQLELAESVNKLEVNIPTDKHVVDLLVVQHEETFEKEYKIAKLTLNAE